MKRTKVLPLVTGLLAIAMRLLAEEPLPANITIRADQPGVSISPLLYGIFFEDINYAADGGLYAEMVQNRSFDYYATPRFGTNLHPLTAWSAVSRGGRTAEPKVEIFTPINAQNPHYLTLNIKGNGGRAGVANAGYDDGIPLKAGAVYDVSLYARWQAGDPRPLTVALESADGTVLASADLNAPGKSWSRQQVTLTPAQNATGARLVVTTEGSGVLCLDMISLFPRDTFKGRRNGLRRDLAQAIADLKPGILRFPGGCLVHGTGLDNAYRWKETVGDLEQRRPKWNRWGYHQTFGLGYYEYFQFCEDIGSEPLPILPAGVSCGFNRPFEVARGQLLEDMIQDAIDLVEFANGSATSTWGRVRAEMGHPAPFNLKYIGLGNEEHDTTSFRELFPLFVKALRAKHPEIKIVGTSGLGAGIPLFDLMEQTQVDISDEHYYMEPEWFIANRNRFDSVKRTPTKVFVGEYASRGNRQFNAVAEAVYLTGIERNADLVVMGAYAPLLARYGFTQWPRANLIWFNNETVVRTPNYYVQQLFATRLGDRYLGNKVEFAGDNPSAVLAISPTLATKAGKLYLKLANPMTRLVRAEIRLEGVNGIATEAELVELAADTDAGNSLNDPGRVAPHVKRVAVGSHFSLEVPPCSVQALTLDLVAGKKQD